MPDTPKMVIANRLRDGLTVFLAADGGWVTAITQGLVAWTDAEAATLLAAAEEATARNSVVNPYLIAVAGEADGTASRRPRDWRDAIRAFGPTVKTPTTG